MLHRRERQDLIERRTLLRQRSRRRTSQSQPPIDRRHHEWQPIAAGRVCDVCLMAQARGEFDDNVACNPHES